MDIIQSVIANMTIILAIIGALAFVVSVVTQVIKGVGVFSKIPTDILVFVLSIGITVAAFVAYMQYIQTSILWYMILAAIIAGFIVYAIVYICFGAFNNVRIFVFLFILYGLYSALVDTSQKAMVSDIVSKDLKGTGFGLYHAILGIALLPASLIAGKLYDNVNSLFIW